MRYKTVKEMAKSHEVEYLQERLNQAKRIIKKLWDYHRQAQDIIKHQTKLNQLGGHYGKKTSAENEQLKQQLQKAENNLWWYADESNFINEIKSNNFDKIFTIGNKAREYFTEKKVMQHFQDKEYPKE